MLELAAGDLRRPLIGRAIKTVVALGVAFTVLAWLGKEIHPFYAASPWSDDPYDAFVSFAIFFVPLLTALMLVRLPFCRVGDSVAAARVADLVRTGKVLLVAVAVTLGAEWVALVRSQRFETFASFGGLDILMLAGLSVLTVGGAWLLFLAPLVPNEKSGAAAPDALDDGLAVGRRIATRLGPLAGPSRAALNLIERGIAQPTRRHPTWAAAIASACFGIAIAAAAAFEEGASGELGLFLFVGSSAMFAFLTAGGGYLHVVRAVKPLVGWRARARNSLVLSSAIVPLVLAFRDLTWSVIGVRAGGSISDLAWLVVGAGVLVFLLAFATQSVASRRRTS